LKGNDTMRDIGCQVMSKMGSISGFYQHFCVRGTKNRVTRFFA